MATFSTVAKAKLYSKVKAINERIADVARKWGQNSAAYKAYERALNKLIPAEQVTTSRAGNIRIKQGVKDIDKLEGIPDLIATIERTTKSAGQYRKEVEKSYKRTYGEPDDEESGPVPMEELQRYDEARNAVREAADSGALKQYLSGDEGRAGDPREERRRLTYDELFDIMDKINAEQREATRTVDEIINDWIGEEESGFDVPFT